jgi:hypothetical protein
MNLSFALLQPYHNAQGRPGPCHLIEASIPKGITQREALTMSQQEWLQNQPPGERDLATVCSG